MHPRYILRAEHFHTAQGRRFVWCLYDTENMRLEGLSGQTKVLVPNATYLAPAANCASLEAKLRRMGHVAPGTDLHVAPPAIITADKGATYLALAKP